MNELISEPSRAEPSGRPACRSACLQAASRAEPSRAVCTPTDNFVLLAMCVQLRRADGRSHNAQLRATIESRPACRLPPASGYNSLVRSARVVQRNKQTPSQSVAAAPIPISLRHANTHTHTHILYCINIYTSIIFSYSVSRKSYEYFII